MSRTKINAQEQIRGIGSGYRRVELDVGNHYVGDATFNVADVDVNPDSLIEAIVLGLPPSDGRSPQEIYLEQVTVFATPGLGSVRFDLQPKNGSFMGKFVIGYQVA